MPVVVVVVVVVVVIVRWIAAVQYGMRPKDKQLFNLALFFPGHVASVLWTNTFQQGHQCILKHIHSKDLHCASHWNRCEGLLQGPKCIAQWDGDDTNCRTTNMRHVDCMVFGSNCIRSWSSLPAVNTEKKLMTANFLWTLQLQTQACLILSPVQCSLFLFDFLRAN